MFVTTKITWSMVTGEVLEHEGYVYDGDVELACGASSDEKALAKSSKDFSEFMNGAAKTVFGDSSQIFQNLMSTYQNIVQGGPSQMGFSQAELNARNAEAINNAAVAGRNVMSAVKEGQSAMGGGNTVSNSGTNLAAQEAAAQFAASQQSSALNKVTQENWATGRENFFNAAKGEQELPSVFNAASGMAGQATNAGKTAMDDAQAVASANSWWQPIVGGLAGAGLTFASGGLSGMAQGGSFMTGGGQALGGSKVTG